MKGERPAEIVGLRAADARARRSRCPVEPGTTRRPVRHGRRPQRARSTSRRPRPSWSAACGVPVAKHGNRSVSSRCGSADVFEALGVERRGRPRRSLARCLDEAGIAFLFAPTFHPSMRHVGAVRRELGVRTAFNLLGPLTNPARPRAPARRRAAAGADRADRARAGAARLRARLGGARRRRPRRALDDGLHEGVGVPGRRGEHVLRAPVRRRAAEGAGRRRWRAATRRPMRTSCAPCWRARRGPARDVVLLNAGAALFVAGRAARLRRRPGGGGRGDRRRRGAARRSTRWCGGPRRRRSAPGARDVTRRIVPLPRRPARRDRGVGADDGRVAGARACRSTTLARAAERRRPGGRRFRDAHRARRPRQHHRRVQAAIAGARRAARGLRAGGDRARLRASRRGGDLGADRADVLRRRARASRGRAGRGRRCRSCARTSSSTSTSCSRRARQAPTRSC